MAENESIGGISVAIVGDYSKLQSDLDAAASVAARGGEEIAQALSSGAAGADALSGAVTSAAAGLESFEAKIQALVDTGSTLAEALAIVQAETEAIAGGVEHAGEAAEAAASQMSLFDEAVQVPYADAAGQLQLFTTELEPIGESAQAAAKGLQDFGAAVDDAEKPVSRFSAEAQALVDAQKQAEAEAQKAASTLKELQTAYDQGAVSAGTLKRAEQELADAESKAGKETTSLVEKITALSAGYLSARALLSLAESALEAADAVDDAGKALGMLSGNAEEATQTVAALRDVANDAALGLPELLTAANRMTAFLGTSKPVPDILRAVADSAAVMQTSLAAASGGFERIVASGELSQRSLQRLGLTMDDVSKIMGVSGEEIKKAFEGLDQSTRVEIMVAALHKFKGAAKEMSDDSLGAFQRLKNSWSEMLEVIGNAIEPLAKAFANFLGGVMFNLEKFAVAWSAAIKAVVEGSRAFLAAVNFNPAEAVARFDAMKTEWNKGEEQLKKLTEAHNKVNQAVSEGTHLTEAQIRAEVQAALAREASIKAAKAQQEILAQLAKTAKELSTELPASYDAYVKQLTEGGKKAESVLNATEEAIRKANIAMEGMRGKPLEAMQALVAQIMTLHDRAKAFAAEDLWNKQAQEVAAFAAKYVDQMGKLDAATLNWVNEAMRAARDVPDALNKVTDAEFFGKWAEQMAKLTAETKKFSDEWTKIAEKSLAGIHKEIFETSEITGKEMLKILPIAVSLESHWSAATRAYMNMRAEMHKAGMQTIQDIESEIKTDENLLAEMQAMNQPLVEQLALHEKILAKKIELAELEGRTANATAIALGHEQKLRQELHDHTTAWGDLELKVEQDLEKGYYAIGDAIVDCIVESKNFGEAMKNLGKQILKTVLEDVVHTALKELKFSLMDVKKTTDETTESFKRMQSQLAGAADQAQGAGKEAGGVAKGAGGLAGTVTAVSSAISAISGVISNFQFAAMNKSLDVIVNHTLRIFNETANLRQDQWTQFNSMYDRLAEVWRDMVAGFSAVVKAIGMGGVGGGGVQEVADQFARNAMTGTGGIPSRGGREPSSLPPVESIIAPPVFTLQNGVPVTSPSPATYNTSTSSNASIGSVQFNIYGATDPRDTARKMADTLKALSPKFAAYSI